MKCPFCRNGETNDGLISVVFERRGMTLVFKDVPAQICDLCEEGLHSETVTRTLLAQAEEAARGDAAVGVRRYEAQ